MSLYHIKCQAVQLIASVACIFNFNAHNHITSTNLCVHQTINILFDLARIKKTKV